MTLFEHLSYGPSGTLPAPIELAPGAWLLQGFALARQSDLLSAIESVAREAPFRNMVTPGGFTMSASMTNCGPLGWVSDPSGYRYSAVDPVSNLPWPAMPPPFLSLAQDAAIAAGFEFIPDACLINRYIPSAKMSLHQDKDEKDFNQPIVSVSLGIPAVFLFGGMKRADKQLRVPLLNGDVVVWGGPARLRYHGILPLKPARHPIVGDCRINLTFRKAGLP
jgi:alkylated DNA repair protein (DNA oxidative demethylase)